MLNGTRLKNKYQYLFLDLTKIETLSTSFSPLKLMFSNVFYKSLMLGVPEDYQMYEIFLMIVLYLFRNIWRHTY